MKSSWGSKSRSYPAPSKTIITVLFKENLRKSKSIENSNTCFKKISEIDAKAHFTQSLFFCIIGDPLKFGDPVSPPATIIIQYKKWTIFLKNIYDYISRDATSQCSTAVFYLLI